jgi:hypothetical protein
MIQFAARSSLTENMDMAKCANPNRMIEVIRKAISDRDIMQCLTLRDLSAVLRIAVESLTPSDVRGFIYRCITNREIDKGLIMADSAIDFALSLHERGQRSTFSDIVGAAIGTLSMMSTSLPAVKAKIAALLYHPHPEIVVAVIENLGHSSSIDNFNRIAELLLQPNEKIASAAADYIEACARDAAFRKRREFHVIDSSAEAFLRSSLLRLERVYAQIREKSEGPTDLARRLSILIAMMYSEVLDSTDWRRFRSERVDERVYLALEQHLLEKIGPDACPHLFQLLEVTDIEEGIKRSALHTLGRLSKKEGTRRQMIAWLPTFLAKEPSESVSSLATSILESCNDKRPFSVLMCLPNCDESFRSVIPRFGDAQLKIEEDVEPS